LIDEIEAHSRPTWWTGTSVLDDIHNFCLAY